MSNRYLDARGKEGWDGPEFALLQQIMAIRSNMRAIAADPLMVAYLKRDRDFLNRTVADIESIAS